LPFQKPPFKNSPQSRFDQLSEGIRGTGGTGGTGGQVGRGRTGLTFGTSKTGPHIAPCKNATA